MLSYREAVAIVLETIAPLRTVEIPLPQAAGKVLAETVQSRWDLPTADNSAMDGFAFAFAAQEAGQVLEIAGLSRAGEGFEGSPGPRETVRIMTGAPLPAGCDTVVPFEEVDETDGSIRLQKAAVRGSHVRARGEEFRCGEPLLEAGTVLRAGEIGLLAAAGISRVKVYRQPRVAIVSTGDELVELGARPGPGQIVNSNLHLLSARLQEEGVEVWPLGVAADHGESLVSLLKRGLEADLLLTTGGVSTGDYDLVQASLKELGFELGFWKVAIKPGKPVLFGTVGSTPVFGLPGNPAAAAATFQLFVRPALRRMAGFPDPLPPIFRVTLTSAVRGGGSRQNFLWGRIEEEQGRYLFTPSRNQSSGQNRSMLGAQALLPVAAGSPDLAAGSEVEVLLIYLPQGTSRLAGA